MRHRGVYSSVRLATGADATPPAPPVAWWGLFMGVGALSTRGRAESVDAQRGTGHFGADLKGGRGCGVTDVRGAWKTEQDKSGVCVHVRPLEDALRMVRRTGGRGRV